MSMKISIVGRPTDKVKELGTGTKNPVLVFTLAVDKGQADAEGKYGTDFVDVKAFPRTEGQRSYLIKTINRAKEKNRTVAATVIRQENNYTDANGQVQYGAQNILDNLSVTGTMTNTTFVGRVAQEPKFQTYKTSKGVEKALMYAKVAVERDYVAQGQDRPQADFLDFKMFISAAQMSAYQTHLLKGNTISVDAHLDTSAFDKDGKKVYRTDVVGDRLKFIAMAKRNSDAQAKAQPQEAQVEELYAEEPASMSFDQPVYDQAAQSPYATVA